MKLKDTRRRYTEEFKNEAVQIMLLDGHQPFGNDRLGLPNVNMLYRWKKERIAPGGVVAEVWKLEFASWRTNCDGGAGA
ncbi:MAG: hypothetical protein U0996_03280 [Planctomycetaceae bacterium]